MEDKKPFEDFQSKFNVAGALSQELSRLRSIVNDAFRNDDYRGGAKALISMNLSVSTSFNKDEKKEINKLQKSFNAFDIAERKHHPQNKKGKDYTYILTRIRELAYELNDSVMNALQNHNYLSLNERRENFK